MREQIERGASQNGRPWPTSTGGEAEAQREHEPMRRAPSRGVGAGTGGAAASAPRRSARSAISAAEQLISHAQEPGHQARHRVAG